VVKRDVLDAWLTSVGAANAFADLAELLPGAAVFAVDAQRDVVFWSAGAERLLGFSSAEVLGRHCLTGIRCTHCLTGCGVAEHGEVRDVSLVLHRHDGTAVPVRKWGRALRAVDGSFQGTVELLLPAPPTPLEKAEPSGCEDEVVRWHGLVSRDPSMLRALRTVKNVAETDATVLVRGESGTGKELVARAIHAESVRRDGPFVAVNCAALSPALLESELFGHVRGAFTGATHDRIGIFEQANHGTLFLDEVGELPLELQSKLLRVLQERVVIPVGGQRTIPVDVRIVAATHRALREEVKAGRFREDLMYRLRVVPLFLPALRERPEDLPLLLETFIEEGNRRGPRRITAIHPDVIAKLRAHGWPGNVRELQNVVARAFAVGRAPVLEVDDLPPELATLEERAPTAPPPDERQALVDALRRSGNDLARAAESLGISRTTLWRKRKRYGI
jgi:two-component system response regulator AtoC